VILIFPFIPIIILEVKMTSEITEIIVKINQLKVKLGELWDEKGKTDQEILGLSIEIDHLLNQYDLIKSNCKN
jgi:hypothetical protein